MLIGNLKKKSTPQVTLTKVVFYQTLQKKKSHNYLHNPIWRPERLTTLAGDTLY